MKNKRLPGWIIAMLFASFAFSQNAPVTTVPDVFACPDMDIDVPVTVADFNTIGALSLTLDYDAGVLTYQNYTNNSNFPGLMVNCYIAGTVIAGGFISPGAAGISLPEDAVLFTLHFYYSGGSSALSWFDDGESCEYTDELFNPLNDLPTASYYINGSVNPSVPSGAPITTAPDIALCPDMLIEVPIRVAGFCNIGALSLTLQYDPDVLTYQSYSNNSGFPGLIINCFSPGTVIAGGFISPGGSGISLVDNSILFTLTFYYHGGISDLVWYDDGESCEYTDNLFNPLNDVPTSAYYSNGKVSFDCQTEWTGAQSIDWFTPGNWTTRVPNRWVDALIPDVAPQPFPQLDDEAACHHLTLQSGTSLTVLSCGALTATGDFSNEGDFLVQSTPDSDGSFIDNGTISGNGSFSVQRYLEQNMWHYVSPLVSDALSGMFYQIYLMEFLEGPGVWNFLVPVNIPLIPMQGYAAWADDGYTGSTTVSYQGLLNTGPLSIDLTHHSAATHNHRGYNFVGNPYPSATDWDQPDGWVRTNIDNAIYLWNPLAGQYGTYVLNDPLSSTNDVDNIIPAGQGFFVHVSDGYANGSLGVNNKARVHDEKPFFKNSPDNAVLCLKLEVTSHANGYSDQTLIQFKDPASTDFDPAYDAYKMAGLNIAPLFYTTSSDGKNLAVNARPALTQSTVIPLHFEAGTDGIHTIQPRMMLGFDPGIQVLLYDKRYNTFVPLVMDKGYSFLAKAGDDFDRFSLHFLAETITHDPQQINQSLNVLIHATGHTIHLKQNQGEMLKGEITVYDLMGRKVATHNVAGTCAHHFNFMDNGLYFVVYLDQNSLQTITRKVYLN